MSVTLNGHVYDASQFYGYGYLQNHPDTGQVIFPNSIFADMLAELAAASAILSGGISPSTAGNTLVSNGTSWVRTLDSAQPVKLSGFIQVFGQISAHAASQIVLDHIGSSISRVSAYGANAATQGVLRLRVVSSDGSLDSSPVIITNTSTSISGNVLAGSDNAFDLGAVGASRFRDLFLGRNLSVAGTFVQYRAVSGSSSVLTELYSDNGGANTRQHYFDAGGNAYHRTGASIGSASGAQTASYPLIVASNASKSTTGHYIGFLLDTSADGANSVSASMVYFGHATAASRYLRIGAYDNQLGTFGRVVFPGSSTELLGFLDHYHASAGAGAGYYVRSLTNTTGSTKDTIGSFGILQRTTNVRSAYFTLALADNGAPQSSYTQSRRASVAVSTSPVALTDTSLANTYGGFAHVMGIDGGGNIFSDFLWYSLSASTVLAAHSPSGSPAARSYTLSSGTLRLAMASGTYTVTCNYTVFGA